MAVLLEHEQIHNDCTYYIVIDYSKHIHKSNVMEIITYTIRDELAGTK